MTDREGEAPAEPRARVDVFWHERLGRSLALPTLFDFDFRNTGLGESGDFTAPPQRGNLGTFARICLICSKLAGFTMW